MIDIPFLAMWEDAMVAGVKTCTTRSKRYGKPGDRFVAFGRTFELVDVQKKCLGDVADGLWQQEGCHSPQEFRAVWSKIHPRRQYQYWDMRWVHFFKLVPPEDAA